VVLVATVRTIVNTNQYRLGNAHAYYSIVRTWLPVQASVSTFRRWREALTHVVGHESGVRDALVAHPLAKACVKDAATGPVFKSMLHANPLCKRHLTF
jgi:hypothetical protein